ncbi:tRNA uracil 4-sulfurtransferase ThiI [Natronospira bacteriovora]|uniref:Probable tRNA sulfurtransferase n=1 Tax=Natronospira bacteriovora TaxID=3069753 RepID=A0ABU0W7D0_9GAMM|nr:tRNA uracil 4-sulfurtransferase ThiI [Natronospira sp. AB-CW4]MDQ2069370.1 tRNA uracil 4-sulfurtransferase ThiI [Natronospira sp. AB-CW4]
MTQAEALIQHPDQGINRILLTYGELALKGRNLNDFKQRLRENIRLRLKAEGLPWPVRWQHKRLYVEVPETAGDSLHRAIQALSEAAGLVWIYPTRWIPAAQRPDESHMAEAAEHLLELARQSHRRGERFRVSINRVDKRFPGRSSEMERELGARIVRESDWEAVSLNRPDRNFQINIYPEGLYVFCQRLPGMGGLPVGSGGRLMTMLSGGIDSPVAAWMMAKRGCPQDFIHFTATHQQQNDPESNKVVAMARHLSRFTIHSRLYLVPYTHFDLAMLASPSDYGVIMFRRFMARVAESLCEETGALALLNGDSLGQVASQTLENMVSKSRAVTLPILRPLVGLDKQEIVDIARRIATYENAIQPYKDCCALIEQSPRTRSRHERLESEESQAFDDYETLIQITLSEARRLDFHCGQEVGADHKDPYR